MVGARTLLSRTISARLLSTGQCTTPLQRLGKLLVCLVLYCRCAHVWRVRLRGVQRRLRCGRERTSSRSARTSQCRSRRHPPVNRLRPRNCNPSSALTLHLLPNRSRSCFARGRRHSRRSGRRRTSAKRRNRPQRRRRMPSVCPTPQRRRPRRAPPISLRYESSPPPLPLLCRCCRAYRIAMSDVSRMLSLAARTLRRQWFVRSATPPFCFSLSV